MTRQEAAEKIRNIADSISEGKVGLESGESSIELSIAENCELEIEVEKESGGDTSLELEIEWNSEKEKEENLKIT